MPAGRNHDQVDVIRHQAIGPDVEGMAARLSGQEFGVAVVVVLREEDLHSPGAALRYVVRHSRDDDARKTSHRLVRRGRTPASCVMSSLL